mgnify:CR=1 FL=1
MKNAKLIILTLVLLTGYLNAQQFVIFSNSSSSSYYDASWGFSSGGSQLELINTSKAPVETAVFLSSPNSIRLKYTSVSGGDWALALASMGWTNWDITTRDTLQFSIYSSSTIHKNDIPLLFVEDGGNAKSNKLVISSYTTAIVGDSLPGATWAKFLVPVSVITANKGAADLTKIKTVFWAQPSTPTLGKQVTLFVDEVAFGSGSGASVPAPINVVAKGYQHHIDVIWDYVTAPGVAGYRVYTVNNGVYTQVGTTDKDESVFTYWTGATGKTLTFAVTTLNSGLAESDKSNTSTATTYELNDSLWLDMIQESTFRYFWNYAHPVSGLARERRGSGDYVTTGGSGFGIMAIPIAVERGFITRAQAVERMNKILDFLTNKAKRYHGAYPHWFNGSTGAVIPFSQYDDGGDLVETSFLIQGLLACRSYFATNTPDEDSIRAKITRIWQGVEWSWYRRTAASTTLYWHWSPNYAWQMNFALRGWAEWMITYILAIASPTYSVPASLYHQGLASGTYLNGKTFYGYKQYVGYDRGGPLFFTHYSFLGFDPRGIKDKYANYFINNRNTSLINRAYCIENIYNYPGYNSVSWGLTASDNPDGYAAHEPSPGRDNGTISPTAALSAYAYIPNESFATMKNFYLEYGANLYGPYGFKDAFNLKRSWFASSYLAIDQGPIVVMIENGRTGKPWSWFMSNSEITAALDSIGFTADPTSTEPTNEVPKDYALLGNYPNPFNPSTTIEFSLPESLPVSFTVYNMFGESVYAEEVSNTVAGVNRVHWDAKNNAGVELSSGIYIYAISNPVVTLTGKMVLQK